MGAEQLSRSAHVDYGGIDPGRDSPAGLRPAGRTCGDAGSGEGLADGIGLGCAANFCDWSSQLAGCTLMRYIRTNSHRKVSSTARNAIKSVTGPWIGQPNSPVRRPPSAALSPQI